jgi:hypothetical protein
MKRSLPGTNVDTVIPGGRILVKRDLVHLEIVLQTEQETNERLAQGAGSHNMYDLFRRHHLSP